MGYENKFNWSSSDSNTAYLTNAFYYQRKNQRQSCFTNESSKVEYECNSTASLPLLYSSNSHASKSKRLINEWDIGLDSVRLWVDSIIKLSIGTREQLTDHNQTVIES